MECDGSGEGWCVVQRGKRRLTSESNSSDGPEGEIHRGKIIKKEGGVQGGL